MNKGQVNNGSVRSAIPGEQMNGALYNEVFEILKAKYIDPEAVHHAATIRDVVKNLGDRFTQIVHHNVCAASTAYTGDKKAFVPDLRFTIHDNTLRIAPKLKMEHVFQGLNEGQHVLSIGGIMIHSRYSGSTLRNVSDLLAGHKNSSVPIGVGLGHQVLSSFTVKRDIPRRDAEISEYEDLSVLRIERFSQTTQKDVASALSGIENKEGIIIDLRGNFGGLVSSVIETLSIFMQPGAQAYTHVDNQGRQQIVRTYIDQRFEDIPVAIVADRKTASSAEIFAAALRSRRDVSVFGERTYGKGITQHEFYLSSGAYRLIATTRKWLTPEHECIHEKGILPEHPSRKEDVSCGDEWKNPNHAFAAAAKYLRRS
jgi:carboxyl-terminal processing protease